MARIIKIARLCVPPAVPMALRALRGTPEPLAEVEREWEYVPEGWSRGDRDSRVKGWNAPGVVSTYRAKWDTFRAASEGTAPLGISHEARVVSNEDFDAHNALVSYGYVLALAARSTKEISVLDWGGGIGHFYVLARALLPPDVRLDYHCRDLPLLCAEGRRLLPGVMFHDDDGCLSARYDLVLVSGSLQFSQDWRAVLHGLADATGRLLFVTRVPLVQQAESFVVLQRAYRHGYNTEYLGWVFNRSEFEVCASETGLILRREFLIAREPLRHHLGPEPAVERGFLFERP